MNNFFVVTNTYKDTDYLTTNLIKNYLEEKGKKCTLYTEEGLGKGENYLYTNPDLIPKDTECIIVLGGDGTLIQAARDLAVRQIPFIGVNFGKLGYLAEVQKETIIDTLEKLTQDQYRIENRIMLKGTVQRDGKILGTNIALNDIVVNRLGLSIIDFHVYVNGTLLSSYTADGMIISTPTGSTAYNLSAGGPIVEPSADIVVLTPICPHTINNRSIILSALDTIEIEIDEDRGLEKESKTLTYDGSQSSFLKAGDQVFVEKYNLSTQIIKLSNTSFIEILHKKMRT